MLFKILHLVGHVFEFAVVGLDFLFLLFDFLLGYEEAFFGSELHELLEIHLSESPFRFSEGSRDYVLLGFFFIFGEKLHLFHDQPAAGEFLESHRLGDVLENDGESFLDHWYEM